MATFTNRSKIPTAHANISKQNISSRHQTSGNFFELGVAKCLEMVPNQKIEVRHKVFSRLSPMQAPTMGDASFHNRAFFVPFRCVWPAWNDFINDVPHAYDDNDSVLTPSVPRISNDDFVAMFTDSEFSTEVSGSDKMSVTDFSITDDGSTVLYYNLTPLGKSAMKLFLQLGYRLDVTYNSTEYNSALPLLCLLKIYMDWYYPSQYAYDVEAMELEGLFYRNRYYGDFITSSVLKKIFKLVTRVTYSSDGDIFVSAWDDPNSPNSGASSSIVIPDINNGAYDTGQANIRYNGQASAGMSSNAPIITGTDDSSNNIVSLSQYSLDALKALSDYLKRNQIAGARNVDRYLARFGVRLPDEVLRRSVNLGEYFQGVDFGDVMSMADTDGAQLGNYAGKGISASRNFGQYVCDSNGEYGMFFVLSTIIPRTSYYQGIARHVKHFTRFDFYSEEFDHLGVQAMGANEVYMPQHVEQVYDSKDNFPKLSYNDYVFGFVPRYAEYKVPRDMLTGDYVLNSVNTGLEAWNLFRNLDGMSDSGIAGVVHDIDFIQANDASQFNRIFYDQTDRTDKFKIDHYFGVLSYFPGKSLWDTYEFENEDASKKVEIENGGSKVN